MGSEELWVATAVLVNNGVEHCPVREPYRSGDPVTTTEVSSRAQSLAMTEQERTQ